MKKQIVMFLLIFIIIVSYITPVVATSCGHSETYVSDYPCLDRWCDGWQPWYNEVHHTWVIRTMICDENGNFIDWDYEDLSHWEGICC